jgi:DNA mismatch repair ATPase MutS
MHDLMHLSFFSLFNSLKYIREQHASRLLLWQVGSFYECFFQDAFAVANALNITLTSKAGGGGSRVPMAVSVCTVLYIFVSLFHGMLRICVPSRTR